MERDFMGLTVKQEIPDEVIDAAPVRIAAMQWSFSNKSSALPQLLSFQGAQEDKPKAGLDSLSSNGLVSLTATEAFNSDHKPYSVKNAAPGKQGGLGYTIHGPVANQTNITISPSVHQSFVATSRQNPINSAMTSSNPVVGRTDLRNSCKISGGPAQLTIFYNGSVCVYDDISPEKAQAIMLLAGNGPPMTHGATPPVAPVQTSVLRSSVLDGLVISQPYAITPRPSSINAISVSHSAGMSGTNNDTTAGKPLGPVSANFLSSGTVPQFRRKSLARFLEKRKERVINASPYADKQSPECSTPGAGSTSLSVNSSGSCPVPAAN